MDETRILLLAMGSVKDSYMLATTMNISIEQLNAGNEASLTISREALAAVKDITLKSVVTRCLEVPNFLPLLELFFRSNEIDLEKKEVNNVC